MVYFFFFKPASFTSIVILLSVNHRSHIFFVKIVKMQSETCRSVARLETESKTGRVRLT